MDGILSDLRALVTATRRLVLAAAGEVTRQARVSAPVPELGASSGGAPEWREDDEPRELERGWDTRDDLPLEGDDTEDTEETEEVASSGPRHGIWIAAGTFVPTFLTIVLGATYLAGLPMGPRLAPGGKDDPQPVVSVVGSQRGSVDAQRQADAPTVMTGEGADKPSRVPSPSSEAVDKAAVPATTWVRGAAFPDRDSAERLAARIEQEGYPSRVRRDDTSATAWVVWIAKHPRGRTPAERRE